MYAGGWDTASLKACGTQFPLSSQIGESCETELTLPNTDLTSLTEHFKLINTDGESFITAETSFYEECHLQSFTHITIKSHILS